MYEKKDLRAYLAGPLFNQQERQWNRRFRDELHTLMPRVRITLPQDFRVDNRFNAPEHYNTIYQQCIDAIMESDIVIAVLDGADVDSGVAFECGYAKALGKPVLGVRTDYREGAERGVNLMLANGCTHIVRAFSFQEDAHQVAEHTARWVRKLFPANPDPTEKAE